MTRRGRFEWDPKKNSTNIAKHGIDFEDAISAFEGPAIQVPDLRHDYGEDRWKLTGLMGQIPVVVVFTEREDCIRILSARRAIRYEIKSFFREISH